MIFCDFLQVAKNEFALFGVISTVQIFDTWIFSLQYRYHHPTLAVAFKHMYDLGQGVDQSYEKAAKLFKMAADRGHVSAQSNDFLFSSDSKFSHTSM